MCVRECNSERSQRIAKELKNSKVWNDKQKQLKDILAEKRKKKQKPYGIIRSRCPPAHCEHHTRIHGATVQRKLLKLRAHSPAC